MKQTIALGIDPGLANTGYAICSRSRVGKISMSDCGILTTDTADTEASRILEIHTGITSFIREHKPSLLAVELVFYGKNVTSALSTQSVITICLLFAEQAGITGILQLTPQSVKASATGSGRADKQLVRRFVKKITRTEISNHHATDAAEVANCGTPTATLYIYILHKVYLIL
ncbi:MAG: crossover junction endodeoxyribonuclease RuvC [Candidatus Poribacteria bacterium]|nr:crossover junction endodeoxyribonuclease RuvC [Candidatus Poribacteria bacterium]